MFLRHGLLKQEEKVERKEHKQGSDAKWSYLASQEDMARARSCDRASQRKRGRVRRGAGALTSQWAEIVLCKQLQALLR